MKFLKPDEIKNYELTEQVLSDGDGFSLIHSSFWKPENSESKSACWSERLEPGEIVKALRDGKAPSVLQSEPTEFEDDVRSWMRLRNEQDKYFVEPLQVLMAKGMGHQKIFVQDVSQKDQVRKRIETFATQNGNQGCIESTMALFEEMFMNAMIDAPREAQKIGVQKAPEATFHLAVDGRRLGIACEDPFGSLDLSKVLGRMHDVYAKGAGQTINLREPGGAGLGCVIMLEHCALLTFGVERARKTIVSALLHRNLSYKRKAEMKKSLHLISAE
jgi:hypothetical protein